MSKFYENISALGLEPANLNLVRLNTTSTYDEKVMLERIKTIEKPERLMYVAIQLSLVGWSGDNLGIVTLEGEDVLIKELFDELGFKYSNPQGAKLSESDVTPSRLVRLFRFHIHDFIRRSKEESFLYKKYCYDDEISPTVIFPGAEHMIKSKEDCRVLLETYMNMDASLGSRFTERCRRVFKARGITL
jgi:hypothetical protein